MENYRESNPQKSDFLTYPQTWHWSTDPSLTTDLETSCRGFIINSNSLSKLYNPKRNGRLSTTQTKKLWKNSERRTTYTSPAIKALSSASYNKTHRHRSPLITSMTLTPTKKCSACQPRQSKIKLTQPGRRSAYKIKSPPFVQKSFLASNTDLPRFYHLIKTHKAGPDIKIRPIVSNINGPAQRISWFLANALKPDAKKCPSSFRKQSRTH